MTIDSHMTIEVYATPNPNARKFVLPKTRFERSTNYGSPESAAQDAGISALFQLDGVYNVLTAQNFVTVNKRADVAWEPLESQIREVLAQHYP